MGHPNPPCSVLDCIHPSSLLRPGLYLSVLPTPSWLVFIHPPFSVLACIYPSALLRPWLYLSILPSPSWIVFIHPPCSVLDCIDPSFLFRPGLYLSILPASIPSTFQLTTPTRGLRIRPPPPLRLGEGGWTERRTVETNFKEHLKRQEAIRKNAIIYTRNLLRIFPAPYLPSSLSDPCS